MGHLGAGRVQVRFRTLTASLGICCSRTDRATRLAYHLRDETLPFEVPPESTILTAGLVFDRARLNLERAALVCHVGYEAVLYSLPLPVADLSTPPLQMPLAPLSEPVIRSARASAHERLTRREGTS